MVEAVVTIATAILLGIGGLVVKVVKASTAARIAIAEQEAEEKIAIAEQEAAGKIAVARQEAKERRADRAQLAELIRGNTESNNRLVAAMVDRIDKESES